MEKEYPHTNRLIHETSPYLLQHAHNPVDWYPWGEEALNRAKREDKPILLSIGYSACHWCHVMERECFEDEAIARLMNERFVNIKVDREERPDLDEIYMNAAQVMTGGGGWPLNVFLTPDRIPFHAGTYFPPEDRGQMPGFAKILRILSDYYRMHREEVRKINLQIQETLQHITRIVPSKKIVDEEPLKKGWEALADQFDSNHGGFGRAPKFPSSLSLSFLLRYWYGTGVTRSLEMVDVTLDRMANGGIHDHLGGGFHRYSVDERWLVPHFEKMLYDNALLSRTYLEAYQATRKERYRRVAEETLDYVLRRMAGPEGGFYSAEDADSEGEEGKFYVWTRDEIKGILGREESPPFCAYYGVTGQGNVEGKASTLNIASPLENVSEKYGIPLRELESLLDRGRRRLLEEREKRIKPARDEKILLSWNGLMISGLTEGFRVIGKEEYLQAAKKAARFILDTMQKNGRLMRVFSRGQSRVKGYSEDYAFFVQGLIDLYEVTFDLEWLQEAYEWNRVMLDQFWDEEQGGFFFTAVENEPLIARSKNPYDHVTPSANSAAVFNLLRLAALSAEEAFRQKAEQTLQVFLGLLSEHPSGFANMLSALAFFLDPQEIGILGPRDDSMTRAMVKEVQRAYLPHTILAVHDPREGLDGKWLPFLREKARVESPVAFVCKKSTCLPPVTNEKELKKLLAG